jgi:radical SAM protein with 4Fe4S-binding SPASM domain
MCTIADWVRQPQVMKMDLWWKILEELGEHSHEVKRVHLYRDGEPLLDKQLAYRVGQLKNYAIRKVGISTNVSLLTEEKSEELFDAGLDELILSVDSMIPEVYEKIRVGLKFDEVWRNTIDAFKAKKKAKSKCQIRVRMIRQESNNAEWESGKYQKWFQGMLQEGDTIESRLIHNWGSQLADFKPLREADVERPCLALWSLCVIFADGTVPLCNVDFNAKLPVGNVRDSSIADLWQSVEQNRRRELHRNHNRDELGLCKGCTVWAEEAKAA